VHQNERGIMLTYDREKLEDLPVYSDEEKKRPQPNRASRELGLYATKVLFAAGALGAALTAARFLAANHAADNADQLRVKTKQDAEDLIDRTYVLSCASG